MSSRVARHFPPDQCNSSGDELTLPRAQTHSGTISRQYTDDEMVSKAEPNPSKISTESEFVQVLKAHGGFIKHYEIIRDLGEGGMGVIFLARDTKLGRLVAIKFLKDPSRGANRLIEEAQTTAGIKHENVVTIHDIDEFEDHLYLVLEYVEGRTLRRILLENATSHRQLAKSLALSIVTQVVRGLIAAHARGIVHRDLKPENVMLLDTGQVKILDFGIAKRMDRPTEDRIGTRPYMAPEQWSGGDIDARADIWAVGLLFFELLTGKHILALDSQDFRPRTLEDLDDPGPRLATLGPNLADVAKIIEQCLQKRAEDRYASAAELLDALATAHQHGETDARVEVAPFAGLSAFQEKDADRFFGRARDVEAVVGRLDRQCFVIVVGPSGAGKSSFVRAGILPALRMAGEAWDVHIVRPGRTPLVCLADAVGLDEPADILRAQPGKLGAILRDNCLSAPQKRRALLFVDQFEEVFTLVDDAAEREAFFHSLLGAADDPSSPVRIVISVRSDFLDRIAEERAFMDRVVGGLYFLRPMERESLREALVRPVEAAGYAFESDEMVDDVLQSLETTKSSLPLLQFTAARLWDLRDQEKKLLTRQSYEAVGGVGGALSTHADALVAALTPHQQRLCRAICLRLVTPQRTRAIVSTNELLELANRDPEIMNVVQYLSNARLLLMDVGGAESSAMVELVHESLIDRWPKLSRWIEENADDAEFLARLQAATAQWLSSGKRPGLLWRDHVAEEARTWYTRRKRTLGDAANEALGNNELQYLEEVISLLERTAKHRRWGIAAAFIFLSTALSAVAYFAAQANLHANRADLEADTVREQNEQLKRQALRGRNAVRVMAARKRLDDPTLALALLREVEPADIPRDWAELVSQTLSSGVAMIERNFAREQPSYCATHSPDGKTIALGVGNGEVYLVDAMTLKVRTKLQIHEREVLTIDWTPDATRLVTVGYDRAIRVTRIDGSAEPISLPVPKQQLNMGTLSRDGERIVTCSADGTAQLWRTRDGQSLGVFRHPQEVLSASFSPDGQRLLTVATDGLLRLWSMDGRTEPLKVVGDPNKPSGFLEGSFSPNGEYVAVVAKDRLVHILDAEKFEEKMVLPGHEGESTAMSWSHDGRRFMAGSKDKTVHIWTLDGSEDPIILRGHKHWVYGVNFSPDDRRVVTTSLDKSVRLWNIGDIIRPIVLHSRHGTFKSAAISPNGQRVAAAVSDNTVSLWDLSRPDKPLLMRGHDNLINFVTWSPDNERIVTSSEDGTARIWSRNEPTNPKILSCGGKPAASVVWSHDNKRLVGLCADGFIRMWTTEGQLLGAAARNIGEAMPHARVAIDPTDKRILVFDNKHNTVDVVEIEDEFRLRTLGKHDAPVTDAQWSSDGRRVASTSFDQTTRIWDVDGRFPTKTHRDSEAIFHVQWSPNDNRLAIHRANGVLVIRDARDDETLYWETPPGHEVDQIFWHPGGERIFSTSNNAMARVWNADGTGQPFVYEHTATTISEIAMDATGNRILLRPDDNKLFVWPDIRPFTGPDDSRLWHATTYCIPASIRIDLLGIDEKKAREDESACKQKIDQIMATGH